MKGLIFIALIFFFVNSTAQMKISGMAIDTLGMGVPFVPIGLVSLPDSNIVKGTVTDESGKYSINVTKFGIYVLKVSAIGFQEIYSQKVTCDSLSDNNLMINIEMRQSENNLDEISVTAVKRVIEFKNGNVIVNVENSPLAKGNTVFDLLSKLPGVNVDNDIIQLKGKSGVIVMIDGRVQSISNTQLMNTLKSMNAELVEKIELMKNPPVKYDASGTSGMINIKTKKAKTKGYSGALYTSCSQGIYGRSMAGANLNYKTEKVVLFSNIDYNYGVFGQTEKFTKQISYNSKVTEFKSVNNLKDIGSGLNYKLGADWMVDKKNTLGFKVDGGPGSYTSLGIGSNNLSDNNDLGFDHLTVSTKTPDKWNYNNYNVNAQHDFDTLGTNLVFSADYTDLSEKLSSNIENRFLDKDNSEVMPSNIFRSSNLSFTNIFASKLDFVKVFNSDTYLETGAKASFITSRHDYLFEVRDNFSGEYFEDTVLTNNYTYSEQTYAAYMNFIKSIKKFNLQFGLRVENTTFKGKNTLKGFEISRSYFNLFPNLAIEYLASEKHSFQLNYNRRIDRPQYEALSPFQFYQDQYKYFEGNPFLLPHYSNNFELTHNFKESFSHSLSYSRIDNIGLTYTKQNDSSKVTIETIKNMKYNNYYAYSFYFQHSLTKWWEVSLNGLAAYIEYTGDVDGEDFRTATFSYAPSLTNTFVTPKDFKIEIITLYNGPRNAGFVQIKPRWMMSFAVKKSFFKNKLDCSIGMNDVFYSYIGRSEVNFSNQNWSYSAARDTRRFLISLNYNFGRMKIKEREIDSSEEEKGRLKH